MKAKIRINDLEIVIDGLKKVSGIGKYTGLMFRKNSPALLFEFGSGRMAIHSFFCRPFIAVWISKGKVVEYKIVRGWRPFIAPKRDFDRLIEIPLNEKYSHLLEFFEDKYSD